MTFYLLVFNLNRVNVISFFLNITSLWIGKTVDNLAFLTWFHK